MNYNYLFESRDREDKIAGRIGIGMGLASLFSGGILGFLTQKNMINNEMTTLSLGGGTVILDTLVGTGVAIKYGRESLIESKAEYIVDYGLGAGLCGGAIVTSLGFGIGYTVASLMDYFS